MVRMFSTVQSFSSAGISQPCFPTTPVIQLLAPTVGSTEDLANCEIINSITRSNSIWYWLMDKMNRWELFRLIRWGNRSCSQFRQMDNDELALSPWLPSPHPLGDYPWLGGRRPVNKPPRDETVAEI